MNLDRALTTALICLPAAYTVIRILLAFEQLNPFIIMGLISLLFLSLDLLTQVMIIILLTSALISFALMFLDHIIPLISLASGYVISLGLIILTGTRDEVKPHIRLSAYISSIIISILFLRISSSTLTPLTFFMRLLEVLLTSPSFSNGPIDNIFLSLMALSVMGILGTIPTSKPSIRSLILSREAVIALLLAALIIFATSSLSSDIVWIASIILASTAPLVLITYLRVAR
ncbi:MAG: hypothetical protein L2C94_003680 [Aigarchaeota archaeon]|nr:hypothetical protein [Candidatus Wolframiiraptor gerlachensis]